MSTNAKTSTGSAGFSKGAGFGKSGAVGALERSKQSVTPNRAAYKSKSKTHFGPKPPSISRAKQPNT